MTKSAFQIKLDQKKEKLQKRIEKKQLREQKRVEREAKKLKREKRVGLNGTRVKKGKKNNRGFAHARETPKSALEQPSNEVEMEVHDQSSDSDTESDSESIVADECQAKPIVDQPEDMIPPVKKEEEEEEDHFDQVEKEPVTSRDEPMLSLDLHQQPQQQEPTPTFEKSEEEDDSEMTTTSCKATTTTIKRTSADASEPSFSIESVSPKAHEPLNSNESLVTMEVKEVNSPMKTPYKTPYKSSSSSFSKSSTKSPKKVEVQEEMNKNIWKKEIAKSLKTYAPGSIVTVDSVRLDIIERQIQKVS
ncbi:hypothetical protein PPL_02964 [Heterostelium album PN500]|uniref:Uncharacterized protein n=1 Tax=Heterostelium pallidum (strain ATCC 26659 / Pp 5 / PN500) TaxID=670386 RepID=D3B3J6_HETP5|nr:hypothetical protein PPL_02964 [Heterostelium album PN500]EFA83894.1 hypothetical protein PPL_02964 [Heterostelium album PN500]|eukprot:XP_020436011.1 hypothetical protein PPL_02964 [Heterostelium album PN500]